MCILLSIPAQLEKSKFTRTVVRDPRLTCTERPDELFPTTTKLLTTLLISKSLGRNCQKGIILCIFWGLIGKKNFKMLEPEASVSDIYSSETKMTLKKKFYGAHRQGKKDTLAAKTPRLLWGGSDLCLLFISLDFDGVIFSQLPQSFWHRQKSFKKCYTSSKCIMRLHGHYLNGRSDVLQLAKKQTVGGG